MLAINAVVKDGRIKPLEAIDLQEDEEIVVYSSEEQVEEYSDWTDEEWQRFSLPSFMNTGDDKYVDWEDFFNVKVKNS